MKPHEGTEYTLLGEATGTASADTPTGGGLVLYQEQDAIRKFHTMQSHYHTHPAIQG